MRGARRLRLEEVVNEIRHNVRHGVERIRAYDQDRRAFLREECRRLERQLAELREERRILEEDEERERERERWTTTGGGEKRSTERWSTSVVVKCSE